MTAILHLAALAGVCLGLALFLVLAVSAYVLRQVDQELADEAASAPQVPGAAGDARLSGRHDGSETYAPAL